MINKHLIALFIWDLLLQMKEKKKTSTIQFPKPYFSRESHWGFKLMHTV